MQAAGPPHLLQLLPEAGDAVGDQAAVGLDLGLARAAEEAEAAALALEVGPGADQPPRLIVEMGQLDLQPPLRRRRPLAKYLEDEAGAVDHLGLCGSLEILLLDRADRRVDDEQFRSFALDGLGDLIDLARAEQGRRARLADPEAKPLDHLDPEVVGDRLEASPLANATPVDVNLQPARPAAGRGTSRRATASRRGTMKRLIVFRVGNRWFAQAVERTRSRSGSHHETRWVAIPQTEAGIEEFARRGGYALEQDSPPGRRDGTS